MTQSLLARLTSLVLGLLLLTVGAFSVEERPLPVFSITRSDGLLVTSTAMTEVDQYVLMYVAPGCRSCDSLLAMLNDSESPQLAKRVVIIVRASASQAAKYIRERVPPEAGEVTWYADESDQVYKALHFSGTPDLLGIRKGRLMWSISGVMNDSSMVRPVVRKWTKY